ncbi:TnsA-like heteromeric transposase endonuclease subunit [Streptomyces sp. NPDC056663]|uniref:TnsA-like heteromeric transposase endonuclease subunit n=1 Tax=Streptomyces sp. NPDC056663 TaxID=3345899 RepID=UPI0036B48367
MTSRFEDVDPVRTFRRSRGERHFPGWYWAATTGQHVGFESWLERDRLLLMDFDPSVVGIGSQPFWLHWHDGERERRHAPDYFVRREDGSAVTLTMVFHPQVVTLAGLLASREWERRAVATGHVTWLVEQITVRNILLGYVPKDRKDPLIQWVEQHFSTHKFVAFHRSPRIYDAFFPRETIPPPRRPGEDDSETRWSPFHPYYRC